MRAVRRSAGTSTPTTRDTRSGRSSVTPSRWAESSGSSFRSQENSTVRSERGSADRQPYLRLLEAVSGSRAREILQRVCFQGELDPVGGAAGAEAVVETHGGGITIA